MSVLSLVGKKRGGACQANSLSYIVLCGNLDTEIARKGLSVIFTVKQTHRVPARRLSPGAPSRSIVMKNLNYRDRDFILNKAGNKGSIAMGTSKVVIFSNYILAVQSHWASFMAAKNRLRELDLKYALLFPARPKIIVGIQLLFFMEPEEAMNWTDEYQSQSPQRPPRDPDDNPWKQ